MSMNHDQLDTVAEQRVAIAIPDAIGEMLKMDGRYKIECLEPIPERADEYHALFNKMLAKQSTGEDVSDIQALLDEIPKYVAWANEFDNVVTTVGKNYMLDNFLAGSAFTQTGPYMGLISSVSWSATAAADTMASHAGWTEAGSTNAPTFAARIAPAWSAASAGSKGTSAAVSFTMTGAGTLQGAFIVLGSGAVTTLMSTAGTLFSAGAFSGGAQAVTSGSVVNVTYSVGV